MQRMNINSASESQLERLPLIGHKRAARIVDYRRQQGYFRSVEDLDKVPGIGPRIMAKLRPYIAV